MFWLSGSLVLITFFMIACNISDKKDIQILKDMLEAEQKRNADLERAKYRVKN